MFLFQDPDTQDFYEGFQASLLGREATSQEAYGAGWNAAVRHMAEARKSAASVNLTYAQVQQLVEALGGDEDTVLCIQAGDGHSGKGIYVGYEACREDGSDFLGPEA